MRDPRLRLACGTIRGNAVNPPFNEGETSFGLGRWCGQVVPLMAIVALGLGCSDGVSSGADPAASGTGGDIIPGQNTTGPGSADPSSTTGPGATNPPGLDTMDDDPGDMGTGGAGQDIGAMPDDPNAIVAIPPNVPVPTPRIARLSRTQWSNTVGDLLKLDDISDIEREVSGDALVGFDSEADALYVTEQLRRDFADVAETLADRVTGDAAALARLVPADAPADLAGRARAFVTSFGLRAFRRPLTDGEVADHLSLFDQGPTLYPGVGAFEAGASLVIQAMLQSPHFLYRTELGTAEGASSVALNDYEVASKLAFALTNTMPDDALLAAAAAGELQDRANVEAQARRLLDGGQGIEGIANFNFQVYRLGTYEGITRDPEVFPDFTPETPLAMREEVQRFLEWIFRDDRGVRDFYTAPVGFVNSALAPLYGLEGTFASDTYTQVDLDPTQRSGLLTQAGFLSSYISGTDPDIIHRGVFIATRLLCIELPPPDPNATPLVDIDPDMTNRERVEATTGKGTCGEGCHTAFLNPLGYGFEHYDAVGKYRTTNRGMPVDAADAYRLDGEEKPFSNGVELSHLIADSKQTHSCYVQNMMSYLHGRLLVTEDDAIVDYYARLSRAGMISVRDLALDIVTSDAFLTRLP